MCSGQEYHYTELKKQLEVLEADPSIQPSAYLDEDVVGSKYPALISSARKHITGFTGKPRKEIIALFKQWGYDIIPCGYDQFGWYSGMIKTSKGRVIFTAT